MLTDLETVGDGHRFARAAVCIVGGGIAGLVLADRLSAAGMTVLLLEAGGESLEERSQALYSVTMARHEHTGATEGRFRTLGGTSTRWGGQLLPFPEDVFAPPAATGLPNWPISPGDIEPYYDEVARLLGADDLPYDESLLERLGHSPVRFGGNVRLRFSKWLPFARRNVAGTLGKRVLSSEHAHVVVHANVARFEHNGGRVEAVIATDYAGRAFRFEADAFVLAAGTIESCRLALLSGLGGEACGRYFHDHISMHVAELRGAHRAMWLRRLGPYLVNGTLHTCKLEISTAARASTGSLAAMAHVVIQEPEDSGAAAVRGFLRAMQKGKLGAALRENLMPMLRGSVDVLLLLWKSKVAKRRHVSKAARVVVNIDLEQRPSAESRVRLDESVDAMGWKRAVVDWAVDERSYDDVRSFAKLLRPELEAAGLPEPAWFDGVVDSSKQMREGFTDTFHPMGGLRMGDDAATSVVDGHLRMHDAPNLCVASCAVFPTGGSSNPTFTMVALTLRLAEELIAEYGSGGDDGAAQRG